MGRVEGSAETAARQSWIDGGWPPRVRHRRMVELGAMDGGRRSCDEGAVRAWIAGATGVVGQQLLDLALRDPRVERVVSLVGDLETVEDVCTVLDLVR